MTRLYSRYCDNEDRDHVQTGPDIHHIVIMKSRDLGHMWSRHCDESRDHDQTVVCSPDMVII